MDWHFYPLDKEHKNDGKGIAIDCIHNARDNIESQITIANSHDQAKQLEIGLNNFIKSPFATATMQEILNAILKAKGLAEEEYSLSDQSSLNVTSEKYKSAKAKIDQTYEQYSAQIIDEATKKQRLSEAYSVLHKASGNLNPLRGQLLESTMNLLIPHLLGSIQNIETSAINDLLKTFTEEQYNKTAITAGSKQQEVNVEVLGRTIKFSSSIKSDVIYEKSAEERIGYSAKNLANLKKSIKLVSGASVAGMIGQWGFSQQAENWFWNQFYDKAKWRQVEGLKELFILEAITGQKMDELHSAFMVIVNRSANDENIFNVIPVASALIPYINMKENVRKVTFTWQPSTPPLAANNRTIEEIDNYFLNLKMTVSLKLTEASLAQLSMYKI